MLCSYFCLIASNKLCSLWMSCMALWKALNTIFLSWSSCSYKRGKKVWNIFTFNNCVLFFLPKQWHWVKSLWRSPGVCALAQKRENAHWNADSVEKCVDQDRNTYREFSMEFFTQGIVCIHQDLINAFSNIFSSQWRFLHQTWKLKQRLHLTQQ